MTIFDETYTLNNGVKIPKIGFGTWMIEDNDDAAKAVETAIKVGYRHIDTAEAYGNEIGVGRGVRNAGVPREDIFVTTKLQAEFKNYEEAVAAIDRSLNDLNLDYIDMMIIHQNLGLNSKMMSVSLKEIWQPGVRYLKLKLLVRFVLSVCRTSMKSTCRIFLITVM